MSAITDECQLNERELARASEIAAATLLATANQQRGLRFEVMAILLANEVYDIAGVVKMGGSQADAEKLMDDMMYWLASRAMELHAEVAMGGVEKTTKQ